MFIFSYNSPNQSVKVFEQDVASMVKKSLEEKGRKGEKSENSLWLPIKDVRMECDG